MCLWKYSKLVYAGMLKLGSTTQASLTAVNLVHYDLQAPAYQHVHTLPSLFVLLAMFSKSFTHAIQVGTCCNSTVTTPPVVWLQVSTLPDTGRAGVTHRNTTTEGAQYIPATSKLVSAYSHCK